MSVSKDPTAGDCSGGTGIRIGPLALPTRQGVIYEFARHLERDGSRAPLARPGDSLVAFSYLLDVEPAFDVRRRLSGDTKVGCLLSGWNFDPPSDHPDGFDFEWLDALVNDFRGINDQLDTVEGTRGEHFTTLLEWQPKVNPARTALLALVGGELPGEFASESTAAAEPLVLTLAAHGYEGVILSICDGEGEVENQIRFAREMRRYSALPIAVASAFEVEDWTSVFDMNLRLLER